MKMGELDGVLTAPGPHRIAVDERRGRRAGEGRLEDGARRGEAELGIVRLGADVGRERAQELADERQRTIGVDRIPAAS